MSDVRGKGNSEENGLHIEWEELEGDQTHKVCCIPCNKEWLLVLAKALPIGIDRG